MDTPLNTREFELAILNDASSVYEEIGDSKNAIAYLKRYQAIKDSLHNQQTEKAIHDLKIGYETEKKEMRISSLEGEKQLIMWLNLAGGTALLLTLSAFFFLWRWTVQKKRLAEQKGLLAEQKIKQLEQEKQLIATQAVLDGEIQERTRLARDLHDGLGSILAAAKYNLADIKKASIPGTADAERFDKAISLLDESMREMRRVAHHLMPESLSSYGLKQSIADFCNSLSCVKFTYFGDETLFDPKTEVMLYHIMHELVSNALKHSRASHILVQIIRDTHSIALTVQDDGCGFDPSAETKGMGLTNIRTRVAAYNGSLLLDSKPEELLEGIRTVAAGERFLCEDVNVLLNTNESNPLELTRREMELLQLIAEGYTLPELANKMCLGHQTIRSYRKNLNIKLGAHSTAQLLQNAKALKLV
jgi:signal transduction histidine kinase/DNA-binding CsgD family transcriptional regulator